MKIQKLLFLISFSLCSLSTIAAPTLSDSEAIRLVETTLNAQSDRIKLGALMVMSFGELGKDGITNKQYEIYKAYEKIGLISISIDPKFEAFVSGENFKDEDFNDVDFQLRHNGVVHKIVVKKTDKGIKYSQSWKSPQPNNELLIKTGTFKTQKVIKNEPLKSGTDDYRMFMFTYNFDQSPETREVYQIILRNRVSRERRARVLIKHDPFNSEWKVAAYDASKRDEDFITDRVPKAMHELRIKAER